MEDDKEFQKQALASLLSAELASYAATCKRLSEQGQAVDTGAKGIFQLLYRFLQDLGLTDYELDSLINSWKAEDVYALPEGFVPDLAALAVERGARVKIKYDNTYKLKSRDPQPLADAKRADISNTKGGSIKSSSGIATSIRKLLGFLLTPLSK